MACDGPLNPRRICGLTGRSTLDEQMCRDGLTMREGEQTRGRGMQQAGSRMCKRVAVVLWQSVHEWVSC